MVVFWSKNFFENFAAFLETVSKLVILSFNVLKKVRHPFSSAQSQLHKEIFTKHKKNNLEKSFNFLFFFVFLAQFSISSLETILAAS